MDLNGVLRPSVKIKPLMDIKNYIVYKIDNNKDIKRLCKYLTYEPLEFASLDYSGKTIAQPDIEYSLIEDIRHPDREYNIIPYTLNQNDGVLEQKVYIFVHNYKNKFDGVVGDTTIMVDITCPRDKNKLLFGQERIYKIAELIIEELDETFVDEDFIEAIGGYKFEVKGSGSEWIFNGKDVIAYSFPIVVSMNNKR